MFFSEAAKPSDRCILSRHFAALISMANTLLLIGFVFIACLLYYYYFLISFSGIS